MLLSGPTTKNLCGNSTLARTWTKVKEVCLEPNTKEKEMICTTLACLFSCETNPSWLTNGTFGLHLGFLQKTSIAFF